MFAVPSIMKLFEVGRAPMMLIAFPTPCRMVPCSPSVSTAPAPRNSSDRKFRPLRGRSVICFSVMTWPTVAVSRVEGRRAGLHLDRPRSALRSADPGRRATTWSTFRRMPVRLAARKPCSDAVTEYVLTGRSGIDVVAVLSGGGLALRARQLADDRDGCPGHHRSRCVLDRARDLAGGRLCLTVPAVPSSASTAPKMASFLISEVSSSKQILRPDATSPTVETPALWDPRAINPAIRRMTGSEFLPHDRRGRKLLRSGSRFLRTKLERGRRHSLQVTSGLRLGDEEDAASDKDVAAGRPAVPLFATSIRAEHRFASRSEIMSRRSAASGPRRSIEEDVVRIEVIDVLRVISWWRMKMAGGVCRWARMSRASLMRPSP